MLENKGIGCLSGFVCLKKDLVLLHLLFTLFFSTIALDLNADGGDSTLGRPSWTTSKKLSSDTGNGQLEWRQKPGQAVEMFRLKEKFDGKTSFSYVSGRKLKIYRATPGRYEFRLSACVKDNDGYPHCGGQSSKLNFVVTEKIYEPLMAAARQVDQAGKAVSARVAPPGGPDELRPGLWYNPAKSGHGWSFYWANRLALSSKQQNTYDLYGIWYTYEAKTRVITPVCAPPNPPCGFAIETFSYRPVVATMQLVQTGSNTFGGGIYITRNGTVVHAGAATITFSGNETSASINWDVDFQHESLADQESISMLVGEDSSPYGDPTHFAGLWEPDSGADYYIIDDIGTTTELVEVVFYDDDGDPVWIQAQSSKTPTENNTSLCFYYIEGGYAPDLSGSIPSNRFVGSGCDFAATPSSSNRNGRRYFPDWERGRYWVNFTLPAGSGGNAPAGGSVSIGSSASPAYFSKQANFHRIYSNNGNSCDISATVTSCNALLTWFTDGDYPDATAFAYNQTTGQRSAIATSTAPTMENQLVSLSVAGNYVFELRMTGSPGSRLIAQSTGFTVNEIQGQAPLTPGNLNIVWTNQASRAFKVSWSHARTQDVDDYKLEENRPDGTGSTYTLSPGSTMERDFAYLSGPFGNYQYQVRACSTASGAELCSDTTSWINWEVTDPDSGSSTENPWGDNAYGTLKLNYSYNYAMGYHFKAAVDGNITQLGGLFNGTKTVKLLRRGGPELASVGVTSNNAWSYVSITPVAITAGVEYTVAAYLTGSGASISTGVNFPQSFGQVEVLGSSYASTSTNPNAIPDSIVSTTIMYGQADIGFEAGGQVLEPPVITAISNQQHAEGGSPSVQVIASDADGAVTSFDDSNSLPPGLSINNTGLISGTIASGAAVTSPYSVTITATDNDGLSDQDTFIWTVDPAASGECVDVFADDFETDLGWVRNLHNTDTATRGLWERSNPESTTRKGVIYQLGGTPSGSFALVTDGRAGSSVYTHDVDRGPTSISSPPIDLPPGGSGHQLEFDYNFAYRSSSASRDRFGVYLVRASGETLLFEKLDDNNSQAGSWEFTAIDLSAYAGETVRIKFLADDDLAKGKLVEAQVDDVRICYVPAAASTVPSSNPESPPAPAGAPDLGIDSLSSRIGATAGTFRVDKSGSATFSVPLLTAPGSGGIAPQISLDYDSRSSNGAVGVGWSLGGVSAISRCAQTAEQDPSSTRRGITLTSEDRLCLDGQRLVLASGTYGGNGEYRTEIDGISRIVSYGATGNGPEYFKVWRKDGAVTYYGNSEDSRIETRAPQASETVFAWAQNRFEDSAGNYILYQYEENAYGPVEFVLDKVSYTGNVSAGTIPYAVIDFTYSSNRADGTTRHVAGAEFGQTRLLTRIDSRAKVRSTDNTYAWLRTYVLNYEQDGFGRQILSSIQECDNGTQSRCFVPTKFDWLKSEHELSAAGNAGFNLPHDLFGLQPGDVNGDGRPDLLYTEKTGNTYYLKIAQATSSGGFTAVGAPNAIPEVTENQPVKIHIIDLNADGFQDVIYPKYVAGIISWHARLSTGTDLGPETSLVESTGSLDPVVVRIMDYDGDGLGDLLHSRSNPPGKELVVLRNTFTPGGSVGFDSIPQAISFDVQGLFPANRSGWELNYELPLFGLSEQTREAKVFDYNGDGAVDLLVKISRQYCQGTCGGGQAPLARQNSGTGTSVFQIENPGDDTNAGSAQAAAQSSLVTATVSYWLIYESDRHGAFVRREVVARDGSCDLWVICDDYNDKPMGSDFQPVDINSDGLADLAYMDDSELWQYQLNSGTFFLPEQQIGQIPTGLEDKVQFRDVNGDGYVDFLFPSGPDDDDATWQVFLNNFGNGFAAGMPTGAIAGDTSENDLSLFTDFTGDGKLDQFRVDFEPGDDPATTFLYGVNGLAVPPPAGAEAGASNVITGITDAFGAKTEISYKPLTDPAVYSRMRDSGNANWGLGSVVYDLVAPIYVVSEVASSAPVLNNAQAMSRVEYHYVGAKLQAGGRGFVGFGEVISYDPQSGIRTNTRYRQDHPFIGLPADTTQALVTGAHKLTPISDTNAGTTPAWPAVNAATTAPSLGVTGILLSYAVNQWAAKATVTGARFPYIVNALERSHTLAGNFDRKVLTSNTYGNDYGNLDEVVIRSYDTDGSVAFATQTTANTYADSVSDWFLGRLVSSTVTYARTGQPTPITRKSTFAYDSSTGILRQEVIEPNKGNFTVTTNYTLDPFGNRTGTTLLGEQMAPRTSTSQYDDLGRFVIANSNAYGQTTSQLINWDAFGNALVVSDINNVTTTRAADHMGRVFISYTQTGAWSKTINRAGTGSQCPAGTVFHTLKTGGGSADQYQCFDVLGRETRTATQGFDGRMVFVDRYYDESGRPERISEPYFAGDTRYWNRTIYDALGRVDLVLAADGNDQTFDYNEDANGCIAGGPRQIRTTNGLGQSRLEVRNVMGETVAVYDNDCGEVSYNYDPVGNLIDVTGAEGAVVRINYDLAGRKIAMDDPDKGYWEYDYNPLGELTRQLDSKGQAIDFSYDKLGRVTDRRELRVVSSLSDGTYTTVNREITTWNNSTSSGVTGKGQITRVIYREGENGATVHQRDSIYDDFGRPAIVSTSQNDLQLAEETSYDQYGRVFQQFDASGDDHGLRYHYNNRGYLEKLQEAREGTNGTLYQHIQGMDARGNVTSMVLGNGVEVYATYQARSGRVDVLEAYDAQGMELQYVTYRFDVAGNLESRHDSSQARNLDESFSYDGLNRLEQVMLEENGGAARTTLSLQYGASGNITHKSDVGSYLYGQNGAGPHAVSKAGTVIYSYDANGNQVSGDGRTIKYSVFDKATRIEKGGEYTEFSYGIGNQRIQRLDNNTIDEAKTTWYFGDTEHIQVQGENAFFKRYLGGVALADYFPATGQQSITYLIRDHLGSIHTAVMESGLVADSTSMSFGAFGMRRSADGFGSLSSTALLLHNVMTTRGFTGHEHADGLGIIHMNGRIYDPRLGRFLQADPLVQAPKNGQSLNRYTYVYNNPLSYTDPSGYFSLKRFFKKWGRLIVAAVVSYYSFGAASSWAWGLMPSTAAGVATSAAYIGSAAIGGAVAGFVGGAIISGSLKGAVQGAFSGAIMGGVAGYFGNAYSVNRIAADSVAGGISSEIYGQKFKDGLLFGALVSSVTYITVRLRAYQQAQSKQFPGQIGESEGFRGIDGKLAGERIFEQDWIDSGAARSFAEGKPMEWVLENKYIPFKKNLSPLGGLQGSEGLLFGKSYSSGGTVDYMLEGYAGVHDTFNQPFFYTANGTNRTITSFWKKSLGYLINPANIILASPIVLPTLVPDYMRHFYFQVQDQ